MAAVLLAPTHLDQSRGCQLGGSELQWATMYGDAPRTRWTWWQGGYFLQALSPLVLFLVASIGNLPLAS